MSDTLDYPFIASPNHSSRKGEHAVAVVIHYTGGGSAGGSISWLCNPESKVSAHFVISRSGDVVQLVNMTRAAWHAGTSEMVINGEARSNANRFTIGVELANHGLLQDIDGDFYYQLGRTLKRYRRSKPQRAELHYDSGHVVDGYWETYPDSQIDALQGLLLKLKAAGYGEAASALVGHEEIGMPLGRKTDPGGVFPWNRFHRQVSRRTHQT